MDMEYVYCFRNQVNGKMYIGRTNDVIQRYASHKYIAKYNTHPHIPLYKAMSVHGWDNFMFGIIEECEDSASREVYYIDLYNTYLEGYNCTHGGDGAGTGYKMTQEQREAISKRMRGRKMTPEQLKLHKERCKQSMSNPETRRQISESLSNNHPNTSDWKVTHTDGRVVHITNLKRWCRDNNYSQSCLYRISHGTQHKHKDIVGVERLSV